MDKCKEYIYFHYLVKQRISKAALGQRHIREDAGTMELDPCWKTSKLAVFTCIPGIHTGVIYSWALFFPQQSRNHKQV